MPFINILILYSKNLIVIFSFIIVYEDSTRLLKLRKHNFSATTKSLNLLTKILLIFEELISISSEIGILKISSLIPMRTLKQTTTYL